MFDCYGNLPIVQKEGDRAESGFEQYHITQDRLFQSDFDKLIMKQLENGEGDE